MTLTEIASHRGGAALWPENSPTAFRNTLALGCEQIEFDVQMTADGAVVIHHDATLERTTSGRGPLAERTLAELKALTLKGSDGERIMTLEEGIALLRDSPIVLRCEIKGGVKMRRYPGLEARTVEILTERGVIGRTVLTSFQLETLDALRPLAGGARDRVWLVSPQLLGCLGVARVAILAREAAIRHLGLHQETLDPTTLRSLREAGLKVGAWAVLNDEDIHRVLALGVSVFTTDRPDAALAIRNRMTAQAAD